ncbi:MAG: hypothetical protein EOO62_22235 [Hymenobacter sp.]|nr:MAG: hypothetical protein EOO62_22235 [Hymenobacter sp.]
MSLNKRWMSPPVGGLFFWVGLLVGGVGAQAQAQAQAQARTQTKAISSGQAQVYRVPATGEATRFEVPQVRLPDAAAARRINATLVRMLISSEAGGIDSAASAMQQLRQASRECCYDPDTRQWTVGLGLTGCGYQVLFNQGGLLSLAYTSQFTGAYSWERTSHVTFDLRTGRVMALADLLADAPAQLQRRMRNAINRRLADELRQIAETYGDSATVAYVAEQFQWDWATKQVKPSLGDSLADLTEFALTPQKLLLFYRVDFPHINLNFEPDDTYRFAYAGLLPRPLLRQALTLAVPTKSKGK